MTNEQFEELLARRYERSDVEFKGPGKLNDKHFCARVVKAVLGMANRRDGGSVVIGVTDTSGVLDPVGLPEEDFASWRFDDVSTAIASYVDPYVRFDLFTPKLDNKKFVVLHVHEFDDFPVLCKKRYEYKKQDNKIEEVLREGALYVRTRSKPETAEIPSQTEMRDLLDLAVGKGVKKFVTQARRAGLSLSKTTSPSDKELFQAQKNNWTSPLIEAIHSRGYWQVVIRPETFIEERIQYPDLLPLLQKTSVDLRGWDFPHMNGIHRPDMRGSDWIGHEVDWEYIRESWRIYQSAQFMQIAAIREDWPEQVKQLYVAKTWKPGDLLYIEDVVYRFTEIFLFTSRLALTDVLAQDDHMHIDVLVSGLQGRSLSSDGPALEILSQKYQLDMPEFSYAKDISRETLIATPKDLALEAARELFYRAGYQPAKATLEGFLSRLNNPL